MFRSIKAHRLLTAAATVISAGALSFAVTSTSASATIGPVGPPHFVPNTPIPSCGLAVALDSWPSGYLAVRFDTPNPSVLKWSVRVLGTNYDKTVGEVASPMPRIHHLFEFNDLMQFRPYTYVITNIFGTCVQAAYFTQAGIS